MIVKFLNQKIFVDDEEIKFTKYLNLGYGEEHVIKILLEGTLEDASYMFSDCSGMKIKFYKNTNETKRRIFDKSKINKINSMFNNSYNLEIDFSFFNMILL